MTYKTRADLADLLREAHTMITDAVINHYPVKELHTSPEGLLDRISQIVEIDE